jgi:hypothetical protein
MLLAPRPKTQCINFFRDEALIIFMEIRLRVFIIPLSFSNSQMYQKIKTWAGVEKIKIKLFHLKRDF